VLRRYTTLRRVALYAYVIFAGQTCCSIEFFVFSEKQWVRSSVMSTIWKSTKLVAPSAEVNFTKHPQQEQYQALSQRCSDLLAILQDNSKSHSFYNSTNQEEIDRCVSWLFVMSISNCVLHQSH
jgi:hypothetical protein